MDAISVLVIRRFSSPAFAVLRVQSAHFVSPLRPQGFRARKAFQWGACRAQGLDRRADSELAVASGRPD